MDTVTSDRVTSELQIASLRKNGSHGGVKDESCIEPPFRPFPAFGSLRRSRAASAALLPVNDPERDGLELLLDEDRTSPYLLTADHVLQERIRIQPPRKWKALNVRRYRGLT